MSQTPISLKCMKCGEHFLSGIQKMYCGGCEEMSSGKTLCKHGSEPFTCLSCRQNFADEIPLDHPCRNTCSGWKQGYEKGLAEKDMEIGRLSKCPNEEWECKKIERRLESEIAKLRAALEDVNHILNWNADHVCICYGGPENTVRHKKCQYHQIMNVLNREALAGGEDGTK